MDVTSLSKSIGTTYAQNASAVPTEVQRKQRRYDRASPRRACSSSKRTRQSDGPLLIATKSGKGVSTEENLRRQRIQRLSRWARLAVLSLASSNCPRRRKVHRIRAASEAVGLRTHIRLVRDLSAPLPGLRVPPGNVGDHAPSSNGSPDATSNRLIRQSVFYASAFAESFARPCHDEL